jgi:hypothetical protein
VINEVTVTVCVLESDGHDIDIQFDRRRLLRELKREISDKIHVSEAEFKVSCCVLGLGFASSLAKRVPTDPAYRNGP